MCFLCFEVDAMSGCEVSHSVMEISETKRGNETGLENNRKCVAVNMSQMDAGRGENNNNNSRMFVGRWKDNWPWNTTSPGFIAGTVFLVPGTQLVF